MIMIRDTKTFCFNFDLPKDVKFVLNLWQRLDLRSSDKYVALIYLLQVENSIKFQI